MVIALFCIAVLQLAVDAIIEEIAALACLVLSSWIFAALSVGCGRALFYYVIATGGVILVVVAVCCEGAPDSMGASTLTA